MNRSLYRASGEASARMAGSSSASLSSSIAVSLPSDWSSAKPSEGPGGAADRSYSTTPNTTKTIDRKNAGNG